MVQVAKTEISKALKIINRYRVNVKEKTRIKFTNS